MTEKTALTTAPGALAPATTDAETNPALVYLAGLAPTGRRTMRSSLARVAAMLGYDLDTAPWATLRYEHVVAVRTKLSETLKPATVNKYLAALRGTMRAAWRMRQVDAETYQRVADVGPVHGKTLPAGRALGDGELGAIMRVCANDDTPAGTRDAAIVALGYAAGLRRAELASLTLGDLADEGDTVVVRVSGKGGKERLAYLDNGARLALRDWLDVRGDRPGPLFCAGRRGGRLTRGSGITGQGIRDIVARRAEQAGIPALSPHDLRRSFITALLDGGHDLATAAAMAGHASVETTRRYDRRGEVAKRKAARSLHVPYYGATG